MQTIRFDDQGRWERLPPDPAKEQQEQAKEQANQEPAPEKATAGEAGGEAAEGAPDAAKLREDVIKALQTVYDPEIPVDIYQLGLIYDVAVENDGECAIQMTLTTPNCPAAQSLPAEVKQKAESVEGVTAAKVDIVWEPPWGPEKMSDAAKLSLNMMW